MGLWETVSLEKQIKVVCPVFNWVIEKPRTQKKEEDEEEEEEEAHW